MCGQTSEVHRHTVEDNYKEQFPTSKRANPRYARDQ